MKKGEYKIPGGKLVRIEVETKGQKLEAIEITGDFFLHPESTLEQIELQLIGTPLGVKDLERKIKDVLKQFQAQLLGVSPRQLAECIMSTVQGK
jgi:lipoate-protein ligase A